jgi:glycosyltransferase involved in cell wall biosynthesis
MPVDGIRTLYRRATELAAKGEEAEARRLYGVVSEGHGDVPFQALLANDLAALDAAGGALDAALRGFERALALDAGCRAARDNLALLREDLASTCPLPVIPAVPSTEQPASPVRVAVVSLLFNWPSAGGGNVHTAELVHFLARAGYAVRHLFVHFAPWRVGHADPSPPHSQALDFDETSWNVRTIGERFRAAVDAFAPDFVLVSDCWSLKPHLARALRGYPVLLRFQALECLCPLNNVRLLPLGQGRWGQCPKHQLATPQECADCLRQRGKFSGDLHRAERELAGAGTPEYHALLCEVLREADAVLVLNPLTEAMLSPYSGRVKVVPWGMDPARFPRADTAPPPDRERKVVFQAGVVDEPMKGFAVLHAACARLWQKRRDFELVATGSPAGRVDEFTRFAGWQSQAELPRLYREADVVAVPTVAQEGLSRTSVEAMAAGRPVVASRIGGLPWTVADGATGLLCEPGDEEDLACKLETLLDDADLRRRLGQAGRRRFEDEFTWGAVIERHYRPLLQKKKC